MAVEELTLSEQLEELVSAEDFLDFFEVGYDPHVVHVNRLHILQRFHDYLARVQEPEDEAALRSVYREWLERAYHDFVESDARTEKVLKIYKTQGPQTVFVPLDQLVRQ